MESSEQWRVQFNADVTFVNGGGLQVQEFRLDVPGPSITDREVGELFLRHLGLLMVGTVQITGKQLLQEPHKGSRGTVGSARPSGRRMVDLSHPILHDMVTLPGLPGPQIGEYMSRISSRDLYAAGTEFSIGHIAMVSNTGTHLDSPFHRFEDGDDLAALPLERLSDLEGVVVRATGAEGRAIDRALLLPHDVAGKAVLIHTGWDRHWGTEQYGSDHPFLTAEAATWLADQGTALVGIDSLNVDSTTDGTRPAHTTLLGAGIPIVEHLRGLEHLPPHGFHFHAAPPAVAGMGTFPVRAYALVDAGR
ncbi:cyclase family protein [Streptomyces tropicalis]|uniref:Cyclase family protein n=1 Tax=Streptomyces tropicalis TaxID=3034234 RepID=A0ABT6A489_9ACTN|nr:cyclase family protein [Streptomyces tropicalis]MDF3299442.1 cyclase family protein [Streptomyces tropicalis]